MSVYIPGIEMPTSCSECAFCGYYGNGEHMCDIIQKAVEYESAKMSRLDDCPLVPVPEHGELIEREPILDVMRKERDRISETYGPNDEYVNCLNKYAISIVTSAKTIIPAEEET